MSRALAAVVFRIALASVAAAGTGAAAVAQGTPEQQQACAPDAVKLCSDTIPDVPKTTACMKAHVADLSPRCRTAFFAATDGAPKPKVAMREERSVPSDAADSHRSMTRRAAPPSSSATALPSEAAPPPIPTAGFALPGANLPGIASARAQIIASCREGLIDAFTCHNTAQVFGLRE